MSAAWIVSQLGSREHYAIARGLARRQLLEVLVTDLWWPPWLEPATVNRIPLKPLHRWAGRFAEGLDKKVISWNVRGGCAMAWCYGRRRPEQFHAAYVEHGRWFARRTSRVIEKSRSAGIFFGYSAASLESLLSAKKKGFFTIVDQVDPAWEHWKLVEAERERFPDWEERAPEVPREFWDRLHREWSTADLVVVNSEWSRENLVKQGVPESKLAVVPLAYEPTARAAPRRHNRRGKLRVLWLATVSLAKGFPYLLEAAKKLPNVHFDVAGQIRISSRIVGSAPANVKFHGQVPRIRTAELFRSADVFLLPTISDGFAITQLEAMSFGLPVIATPHCGKVVVEGWNGYIVPARDPEAIASRIAALDSDGDRLADLSTNALATLSEFALDKIIDRLLDEVRRRCQ
jgi:glycosyltransferase involved in cell wall biosynthesis